MSKMLLMPLKSVSLPGIGLGIASTLAFNKFGRPLIVETLKLGYEAKDGTVRMFEDARRLASEVRDEARSEAKAPAKKKD